MGDGRMIIRSETPADYAAIRSIVTEAFAGEIEADLIDALRADGDSVISLVAEEGEGIAGHVLFSRMDAPFRALGLGPVAVLPARQRSGIGAALIRAGIEEARRQGWQGVFVLGDPAYYKRFGFDPALAVGFDCVYAGPYLMALPLGETLPAEAGRVTYAPAFARIAS
jgi:putative acetyltransferase